MNTILTTVYTTGRLRTSPAVESAAQKHKAECEARLERCKKKGKRSYRKV
jgi:hypothetical protein